MENLLYIITILMIVSWIITLMLYKYSTGLKTLMRDLMETSTKVKSMNFDVRMRMSNYEGFNVFANNFNNMVDMLDRSFEKIEDQNIQLNSVIKSVSNGMLVIDITEKVYLINEPAKKYLKCPEMKPIEGEDISNVIFEETILSFLKENMGCKLSVEKELENSDGQIFTVTIDPVIVQGEMDRTVSSVVNIYEITERIKLENMRKDFAANVSHELKTPLTSIQGFIETLKSNDDSIDAKTRKRFLNIIESESNRLRILINDILLLSSIEGQVDLTLEDVDICHSTESVFNLLAEKARSNMISLEMECNLNEKTIHTHKHYFKELLINLVTNGIKYGKHGGFVKVVYSENDLYYVVEVLDDGIGISENEIERIFERFYRVTKSRNKGIEGTGLGLAIIKHIVISLDGKIEVDSCFGKGSVFRILLPK